MNERDYQMVQPGASSRQDIGNLTATQIVRFNKEEPKSALVSVVIPCFNYGRFLPGAVESVIEQEGVDTEVIIVDDCSTDGSHAVAKELARTHTNVSAIAHTRNQGPVETFNDGLALASGEFLVRLDADDLLTPGALKRAVRVLQDNSNLGMVYGHPLHFAGSKLPKFRQTATEVILWPGLAWLERRCMDGLNVITSPEVVMRKSLVDVVGGQMPLAHTHDMEMWLRIAAFSDVAFIRGCDQAWHRDHALSLSARLVDVPTDLVERRLAFETLFAGIAADKPWVPRLREMAAQAMDSASFSLASHELDRGAPDRELVESLLKQVSSSKAGDHQNLEMLQSRIEESNSPRNKAFGFFHRVRDRTHAELSQRRWRRSGEY